MLVRLAVVRGERKEKPLNQLPPINCSREDDTYDIVRTNERESNDDDANLGPDETSLNHITCAAHNMNEVPDFAIYRTDSFNLSYLVFHIAISITAW